MRNQDDMDAMFDALPELTEQQKTTIKNRYRFLMSEYRRRAFLYSILFYVLRITMTVGSLAVPAMLSLKTRPEDEDVLYWTTWFISLAVTTANGLTTLFKLDKRFFLLHGVAERLRSETWQYLSLSGRYAGHYGGHKPNHRNQFVYYTSRIERIRMKHIDEEFIRQADIADGKVAPAPNNGPRDNGPASASVPSPPDQSKLAPSPPRVPDRAETESTVGSNHDAIAHVNDEEKGESTHTVPMSRLSEPIGARDPILSLSSDAPLPGVSSFRR
jgi:hypothetical protein